ncbi:hypothetical protein GCM10025734_03070 [Kitasatospora paranensis]
MLHCGGRVRGTDGRPCPEGAGQIVLARFGAAVVRARAHAGAAGAGLGRDRPAAPGGPDSRCGSEHRERHRLDGGGVAGRGGCGGGNTRYLPGARDRATRLCSGTRFQAVRPSGPGAARTRRMVADPRAVPA